MLAIEAIVNDAGTVGNGARLVIARPTGKPHLLLSTNAGNQPWLALSVQVLETGEAGHQRGAVAAPIHGPHGLRGALLVYCPSGHSSMHTKYLALGRAHAAHIESLLRVSAGRLSAIQSTVDGMIQMLTAHDAATARHAAMVRHLARALGTALALAPAELLDVEYAALLHDIGKVVVPSSVLGKKDPLTASEWSQVRKHPTAGERIIRAVPQLLSLAPAIRHHHEHWDGGGYPDRLSGSAIPLYARIISLADAYEAMRTGRPYLPARSGEEVLRELRASAGSQFDPDLIPLLPALSSYDIPI